MRWARLLFKEKGHESYIEKGVDTELGLAECAASDSDLSHATVAQSIHALRTPTIKLDIAKTETFEVVPYSQHYALHQSNIVITNKGIFEATPHVDSFTAKSVAVMKARMDKINGNCQLHLVHKNRKLDTGAAQCP